MGCNFVTLTFPGSLNEQELRAEVDEAISRSQIEDGSSYSGEIGMAMGLIIDRTLGAAAFGCRAKASMWLDAECVKWEEAKAVRFKDNDGVEHWLVGCQCAS